MGWLVIALGSALSAIGTMAIKFGWEIVRDERGWTQVIAGSVGLSGGIVTIALGLVVMRLGGLRRDLGRLLQDQRTAAPAKPLDRPPAVERPPPQRKRRKDIPAATTPAQGLGEMPGEMPSEPPAPVTATFAPTLAPSGALAAAAAAGRSSTEDFAATEDLASTEDPVATTLATAGGPERPAAEDLHPPAAAVPPARTGFDEPAIVPERRGAEASIHDRPEIVETGGRPAVRKDEPFSYDRFERELAKLDRVETAATAARHPEPALVEESPAEETKPGPVQGGSPKSTVVGQYEAGGVAYIMYADGSIEADTPNGVYRFVDINELKAFIQSQGST